MGDTKQPETIQAAKAAHDKKTNADALSGEHGSHPAGVGIGAAAGASVGAGLGAVGGPVGIVAGAAAGGLAGAIVGKKAGEALDPTVEDAYWKENFLNRSYFMAGKTYEYYQPAYRHGWVSYGKYSGKQWNEIEPTLKSDWESSKPTLAWIEATPATRDAWDRLEKANRS